MNPKGAKSAERARVWRPAQTRGVEMLHASYQHQNFSRHFHSRFALGVIEQGALRFNYLGQNQVAAPGEINLCVPGEAHDGQAASSTGWRYRMFYLDWGLVKKALAPENKRTDLPHFGGGVVQDPELARGIWSLHRDLEGQALSALETESRLYGILTRLIRRHGRPAPALPAASPAGRSLELVRDLIHAQYQRNLSLAELSREAGLSPFHLLRSFKRHTGLPPHAYQNLLRAQKARELIASGRPLAETALTVGFADQSHFNRVFKRIFGLTPGQYRNSVQDTTSTF